MAKPKCGTAVANPRAPAVRNLIDLRMSLLTGGMKSLVCIGAKNVCSTLFTRIATKFESKNVASGALASVASFQLLCAGNVVAIGNSRLYGYTSFNPTIGAEPVPLVVTRALSSV